MDLDRGPGFGAVFEGEMHAHLTHVLKRGELAGRRRVGLQVEQLTGFDPDRPTGGVEEPEPVAATLTNPLPTPWGQAEHPFRTLQRAIDRRYAHSANDTNWLARRKLEHPRGLPSSPRHRRFLRIGTQRGPEKIPQEGLQLTPRAMETRQHLRHQDPVQRLVIRLDPGCAEGGSETQRLVERPMSEFEADHGEVACSTVSDSTSLVRRGAG